MAFKKSPQKIVIPAGTLNPDENNIIDIPIESSRSEIIIAQAPFRKQDTSSINYHSVPKADPATPEMTELELREKKNFEDDLKKFQNSRRKLFFHIMSLQMTKLRKVPSITN